MDEPFGALDPVTRRELQDEFCRLQRQLGTTVILVTHDLREACRMGDRLALLHEGCLVQVGPALAFLNHPQNDYVRDFFRDASAVDVNRNSNIDRVTR
jgi:ABC-type proline/glycine betaine transport system ATPase subunit